MTNEPIHHPAADLLMGAVAGELCPGLHLAVKTHCGLCSCCASTYLTYETVANALLPEADMGFEDCGAGFSGAALRNDPVLEHLPAPLQGMAAEALVAGEWERRFPGIVALDLDLSAHLRQDKARVAIVRVDAGVLIPEHDHAGTEALLVLAGGFTDHRAHYRRGDISLMGRGEIHSLQVAEDEPCYWLFVNEAPLLSKALPAMEGR